MLCKLSGEAPTLSACLFYTSSAGILSSYGRLQELEVRHRRENDPVEEQIPIQCPLRSANRIKLLVRGKC